MGFNFELGMLLCSSTLLHVAQGAKSQNGLTRVDVKISGEVWKVNSGCAVDPQRIFI